jgi:histidine triad (HIT) family protein
MALTDEQAKSIKEQLMKQIESFPEDKREGIKNYISSLNNEQLEKFLIQNKLMKPSGEEGEAGEAGESEGGEEGEGENSEGKASSRGAPGGAGGQCVMCLIAGKQIESLPIYEDKDYLAVLEINPITKGHTILIPKKHLKETKEIKSKAFAIANKVGKHIVKKLGAENYQITSSDEIKHALINIIPRYKGEPMTFEKKPMKKPELQDIAMKIGKMSTKEKKPAVKKEKPTTKEGKEVSLIKFPRRIP